MLPMLIRYGEPTKYDHSPYGTPCKVVKGVTGACHIYIQLSQNESEPNWEFMGIFENDADDVILKHVDDFIKQLLT